MRTFAPKQDGLVTTPARVAGVAGTYYFANISGLACSCKAQPHLHILVDLVVAHRDLHPHELLRKPTGLQQSHLSECVRK